MIEKNSKGKIKNIKLDKITSTTNTGKVAEIINRQKELEETLNFTLKEIQNSLKRTNKF